MNLAFSVTDNYIDYMAVTLLSALKQTSSQMDVYILTSYLSEYSRMKIEKLQSIYPNVTCHIIEVDVDIFAKLPLNREHIQSFETYFRLAFPTLLPETVDKLLYLDCDLLIQNDLQALWETDFSGYYMAGVPEPYSQDAHHYRRSIGMMDTTHYVNAGVLLIDLQKMREDNIQQMLFECAEAIKDKILLQDQDIINVALEGKIYPLAQTYNFNHMFKGDIIDDSDMTIIHFALVKPWDKKADINEYKRRSVDAYLALTKEYRQLIEPLVTVVVSIEEVEGLEQHLASIQKQTYQHLDIVLLDAVQSSDTTYLCRAVCEQDNRFRYYRVDNKQLFIANGIDKMLGEYVFFVDSRNELSTQCIAQLFVHLTRENVSLCLLSIEDITGLSDSGKQYVQSMDNTYGLRSNLLAGCLMKCDALMALTPNQVRLADAFLSRIVLRSMTHMKQVFVDEQTLVFSPVSSDVALKDFAKQLQIYQTYCMKQEIEGSDDLMSFSIETLQKMYDILVDSEEIKQVVDCLIMSHRIHLGQFKE